MTDKVLPGLNNNQLKAVTAPFNGRLQVIAGPGTGKTKVLVSRVAYLLLHYSIPPESLIVTTFTKKAANEMVERLIPIFEGSHIDPTKILMGTFHSICYRIIRRHGKKIGLQNYGICDDRDSNSILEEVASGLSNEEVEYLTSLPEEETKRFISTNQTVTKYHGFDPKSFKKFISNLKSSGISYKQYQKGSSSNKVGSFIYTKYQEKLQKTFVLDFDDCLLECYNLISQYPVLNFIQHVLVDEFQDTNNIQLRLMYEFAKGHPTNDQFQNNVTIVGDPDQSIYAFRDAEPLNFKKMKQIYSHKNLDCDSITLNENYRSTRDILNVSETIMRQQVDRVKKSLNSQIITTFKPVYGCLKSADVEAKWIVYQICHLMALPNVFKYRDISILVRAAYQTRAIEYELVRQRIPYFMVRGKAFWDRKEVVAIMDYLRIVGNPNDRMAFIRTLNTPKRGIGTRSLEVINEILSKMELNHSYTIHNQLEDIMDNKIKVQIGSKVRDLVKQYLNLIERARILIPEVDDINKEEKLNQIFLIIYEESGLKQEFGDDEAKHLNVDEVQRQLMDFEPQEDFFADYIGGEDDNENDNEIDQNDENYIIKFVSSVGLYETNNEDKSEKENEKEKEEDTTGKVALSTIHGSKGLEWPVVFVPGVSEGLLPASFAAKEDAKEDAINEERRCFYVAITRAKTLLYLSSIDEANGEGESKNTYGGFNSKTESRFISEIKNSTSKKLELFNNQKALDSMYEMIKIPKPKFNFDNINCSYKETFSKFINGEITTIDAKNYIPNKEVNNQSIKGFTSARSQLQSPPIRDVNQVLEARRKLAKKPSIRKPLSTTNVSKPFKRHKPPTMTSNDKTNNKAPPYIPNRANLKKGSMK